jgi:hypothetical protein
MPSPVWKTTEPAPAAVDEFLWSWGRWREACEVARSAYERWRTAPAPERALAFEAYCAALDQEEEAARAHAVVEDRVHPSPVQI